MSDDELSILAKDIVWYFALTLKSTSPNALHVSDRPSIASERWMFTFRNRIVGNGGGVCVCLPNMSCHKSSPYYRRERAWWWPNPIDHRESGGVCHTFYAGDHVARTENTSIVSQCSKTLWWCVVPSARGLQSVRFYICQPAIIYFALSPAAFVCICFSGCENCLRFVSENSKLKYTNKHGRQPKRFNRSTLARRFVRCHLADLPDLEPVLFILLYVKATDRRSFAYTQQHPDGAEWRAMERVALL